MRTYWTATPLESGRRRPRANAAFAAAAVAARQNSDARAPIIRGEAGRLRALRVAPGVCALTGVVPPLGSGDDVWQGE